jgi:hypothetical protein
MAIPIATAKASRPKMIVRMFCRPRSLPLPLTASDVPVPVGGRGEGVGELEGMEGTVSDGMSLVVEVKVDVLREEEGIVVAGETVPCGQVFMSL